MRIVDPKVYAVEKESGKSADYVLKRLERLARVPYASEGNITDESFDPFLRKIVDREHLAMVEFEDLTFIVRCDRGVTHELVRHRMASFAQESTRYCNYSREKHGVTGVTVINPFFLRDTKLRTEWENAMEDAEKAYLHLIGEGASAQEARSVLPNSTKSLIVIKMNYRELLHFFSLRCAPTAHPQMRQIAIPLARYCRDTWPTIFGKVPTWDPPTTSDNRGELLEGDLAELMVLKELGDWPEEL